MKIFQNPQVIHIVVELIVIVGLTIWFQKKTSDMTKRLDELTAIVMKHDRVLGAHDQSLQVVSNTLSSITGPRRPALPAPQAPVLPASFASSTPRATSTVQVFSTPEQMNDVLDSMIQSEISEIENGRLKSASSSTPSSDEAPKKSKKKFKLATSEEEESASDPDDEVFGQACEYVFIGSLAEGLRKPLIPFIPPSTVVIEEVES